MKAMNTCVIVDRSHDRKLYRLRYSDGHTIDMGVTKLKNLISMGQLNVLNATIGSDGRLRINNNKLVDKKPKKEEIIKENKRKIAQKMLDLLDKYDIISFDDIDELLYYSGKNQVMELVKKGYGDSHEVSTVVVFGKDYKNLIELAEILNIKVPNYVWYD